MAAIGRLDDAEALLGGKAGTIVEPVRAVPRRRLRAIGRDGDPGRCRGCCHIASRSR